MTETKALAYVNMYGVLGTLENLCAMDMEAKQILNTLKRPVSLCFSVKDGPCCTYHFTKEGCRMTEGDAGCSSKMVFSSPEAFSIPDAGNEKSIFSSCPARMVILSGIFCHKDKYETQHKRQTALPVNIYKKRL